MKNPILGQGNDAKDSLRTSKYALWTKNLVLFTGLFRKINKEKVSIADTY